MDIGANVGTFHRNAARVIESKLFAVALPLNLFDQCLVCLNVMLTQESGCLLCTLRRMVPFECGCYGVPR
jgi:hypothetical protein